MESEAVTTMEQDNIDFKQTTNKNESHPNVPPIQAIVRIRPFLNHEIPKHELMSFDADSNNISVIMQKQVKSFEFDAVVKPDASQSDFFMKHVKQYIDLSLLGYNSTVFTYGQTGSGKTYTMDGLEYYINGKEKVIANHKIDSSQYGIIPRALDYLFSKHSEGRKITISFYQLYNEHVYDLFSLIGDQNWSTLSERALSVRWNSKDEFFVENLFHFECTQSQEALDWFFTGVKNKYMASHRLNHSSSRSHCVFEISIEQQKKMDSREEDCQIVISKLTFVDLAGSEKLQHYKHDQLMRESININRSLLTLGKCITALTDSGKGVHVPYRESQLTKLLKPSLGGNCFTAIVACLSPSDMFLEENINTLYYASRARSIKNEPFVNEDEQQKFIRKLKNEIKELKAENISLQQLLQISQGKPLSVPSSPSTFFDKVKEQEIESSICNESKFLQEKVVSSVQLLKKFSSLNHSLRQSFDTLEDSYTKLQMQNKELEIENQSLRKRMELLMDQLKGNGSSERSYLREEPIYSPQYQLKTIVAEKSPQNDRLSGMNRISREIYDDGYYYKEQNHHMTYHMGSVSSPSNPDNNSARFRSFSYDLSRFKSNPASDVNEIANLYMRLHSS